MLRVGCHLSSTEGYLAMAETAASIGANTWQCFSRSPRGGAVKAFDQADAARCVAFCRSHGIRDVLTHAPYVLNPCAADPDLRKHSLDVMREDIERLEFFPAAMYNFHPGCHVKQGAEIGIRLIADHLNALIEPGQKTVVLLETMAGKGTEMGGNFEELLRIIDLVREKDLVGICLDTCHVSDAGCDLVHSLDRVIESFDRAIGIEKLCAVHLNDSKNPCGSHKDRHEKLGEGFIGWEAIGAIINHPALKELPFYLETPQDVPGYAAEIAKLKELRRIYEKENMNGLHAVD